MTQPEDTPASASGRFQLCFERYPTDNQHCCGCRMTRNTVMTPSELARICHARASNQHQHHHLHRPAHTHCSDHYHRHCSPPSLARATHWPAPRSVGVDSDLLAPSHALVEHSRSSSLTAAPVHTHARRRHHNAPIHRPVLPTTRAGPTTTTMRECELSFVYKQYDCDTPRR